MGLWEWKGVGLLAPPAAQAAGPAAAALEMEERPSPAAASMQLPLPPAHLGENMVTPSSSSSSQLGLGRLEMKWLGLGWWLLTTTGSAENACWPGKLCLPA